MHYRYSYSSKGCQYAHHIKVVFHEHDSLGAQMEGYLNADNIFDIARILDLYKTTKTLVLDA